MSDLIWSISGLFLGIGVIFVVLGLASQKFLKKKERFSGSTTGTVIDIVLDEADEDGKERGIREYFYPVLGYYANGILHKVRCKHGSYPSKYKINDTIKIKYDEHDPSCFVLAKSNRMNRFSRLLYVCGIASCVLADVIFIIYSSQS
ncbi:MAG TPA: hypothetical protein IAC41_04670 [Candidatus Merdenecus merdavium]|nr:hypothetical protein [Candidatus Merdenecus merdavium]